MKNTESKTEKTFSAKSSAIRNAKKEGYSKEEIVLTETDGRWAWALIEEVDQMDEYRAEKTREAVANYFSTNATALEQIQNQEDSIDANADRDASLAAEADAEKEVTDKILAIINKAPAKKATKTSAPKKEKCSHEKTFTGKVISTKGIWEDITKCAACNEVLSRQAVAHADLARTKCPLCKSTELYAGRTVDGKVVDEDTIIGCHHCEWHVDTGMARKSNIEKPVAAVHRIATEMKGARRKDVIAACVEQGIAFGTARTQYQHWFKAQKAKA